VYFLGQPTTPHLKPPAAVVVNVLDEGSAYNAITTSFKTSQQFLDTKANPVQAWTALMGSRISKSAHDGGKVVSPTQRPPLPQEDIPGIHFCYRLSPTQSLKDTSMKNPSDPIGNRTRDSPSCSALPQPTEFLHTGWHKWLLVKATIKLTDIILSNFFHNVNSMVLLSFQNIRTNKSDVFAYAHRFTHIYFLYHVSKQTACKDVLPTST
jgi:hypothetical protein